MRKSRSLSASTARFLSAARRTGAGTDRGWHNTADRDLDRVSMQVMILSQMRQNDR